VRGQNTTTDQPLPFIPPFRLNYGVRWERGSEERTVRSFYVDLGGETNAEQGRLDPEDFAPEGYTIANAGAGVALGVGQQVFNVDLAARNLFDTRYANFMSRYKAYAPDPGRNVTLRLTWQF
jgi:iron complex outermembrane receptor protein